MEKNQMTESERVQSYNVARLAIMRQYLKEHTAEEVLAFLSKSGLDPRQSRYVMGKHYTVNPHNEKEA